MSDIERCHVPPEGWWCSREKGHDGPCAAREVEPMSWEELATRLQTEKIALHDQLAGAVDTLRELSESAEMFLPIKRISEDAERFRLAMVAARDLIGGQ